jgi:pyruvate,water dikinase
VIQVQPFTLTLAEATDINRVGCKAANLGHLIRGGFCVPPGFVIDTQAFRSTGSGAVNGERHTEFGISKTLADEIGAAYHALGRGPVAVRSSATAEDLADASMAGQYETVLDVEGDEAILEAVRKCWASFDAPRIHAYFREHSLDPADVAMAVIVQRLVPAEVAGVLFSTNPQPGRSTEMLIEASRGLGEAVVSGRVQPDVFRVSRDAGEMLSTSHNGHACLSESQIRALWQLGRRVAEHFDAPQDIEWAIHDGKIFLLQSRPITTLGDTQLYEDLLHSTQQHLRDKLGPARGPWVLHNLAETLPHPAPLSWSIIRRYMSGDGRGLPSDRFRTVGNRVPRWLLRADRRSRLHGCFKIAGNVLSRISLRLRLE